MNLAAVYSFLQGLCLAVVFHVRKKGVQFQRIQLSSAITAFKLSFLVVATNLIQLAAYRVDFWLIERFYSRYEVGIYAQANKFAALIWVLPAIFSLLLLPKFAGMQQREVPALFRVFVLVNLLVVVATGIGSALFYTYYLLPQFREGQVPLYIMLPGYYCWSLVMFFSALFSSKGKFILNFYGSLLCFAVMLLCDVLLIPPYGLRGAAAANSLTYFLVLLYYLVLFKRTTSVRAGTLFRFCGNDVRIIGNWINQK